MGLEIVKFVMEVEEAFQFRISDEEAQQLDTPRRCLDFIHGRVPQSTNDFCLSQRAFYRLRRAVGTNEMSQIVDPSEGRLVECVAKAKSGRNLACCWDGPGSGRSLLAGSTQDRMVWKMLWTLSLQNRRPGAARHRFESLKVV